MTTTERPTTLCEAFQRTAAIAPDAVALRTPGDTQTMTWREFATQVRGVAAGLAGLGVRRGHTVVADDGQPDRVLPPRCRRPARRSHLVLGV